MKKYIIITLLLVGSRQVLGQQWKHLTRGKGLTYTDQIPLFWPGGKNEVWPGLSLPFPLVQTRNDSSFSYFKAETGLVPYSNPIIGAYPWKGKTILLHGFLPAYTMGLYGQCNGGVLQKESNGFVLQNSINTPALANAKEKFWYHSTKSRLDSSVWIAADTGFRRLNLNTLETKILKDDSYKGIALYNRMSAFGNRWAAFRNDYGIWCMLWGDTSARIISGVNLGIGPNRFVFDIAETPGGDTLFTASDFLGDVNDNFLLYSRKNGTVDNLSLLNPNIGDSLTFVETEKDGTTWLAHRSKGLLQIRIDVVRNLPLPDSLKGRKITQIAIDEGNNKWLSLENNGLLRFNDIAPKMLISGGKRVCLGDSLRFENQSTTFGPGIARQKWDFSFGDTSSLRILNHTFTRPGKYPIRLTIWDLNGTENQIADSITVDYPVPTLLQTENDSKIFCSTIRAWTLSPFENTWQTPGGQTLVADTLVASEEGAYILIILNGTCTTKDTVVLISQTAREFPVSIIENQNNVAFDTLVMVLPDTLLLNLETNGESVCNPVWQINQKQQGTGISLKYNVTEGGKYDLAVSGSLTGGCLAEGKRTIWIEEAKIIIPTMVTANGDGKNDFFEITKLPLYPDNELNIFNRWGKEVFSAKPYNNKWPDSKTGQGTYFYRLRVAEKNYTGWVEMLK